MAEVTDHPLLLFAGHGPMEERQSRTRQSLFRERGHDPVGFRGIERIRSMKLRKQHRDLPATHDGVSGRSIGGNTIGCGLHHYIRCWAPRHLGYFVVRPAVEERGQAWRSRGNDQQIWTR